MRTKLRYLCATALLPIILGCQAPEEGTGNSGGATGSATTLNAKVVNFSPDAPATDRATWLFLTESETYGEYLLKNRALRTSTEVGDRIIVVLPIPDMPVDAQADLIESTVRALAAKGAIDPNHLYLIGFGDMGTLALDLAADNHIQVAATIAFGSSPRQMPDENSVISPTFFVVGESELGVEPSEVAEGTQNWAAAAGCTMTVSSANEGIRQRGHYDCRNDATVIFATIIDYDARWPNTQINLVRLIDSFFTAYAK